MRISPAAITAMLLASLGIARLALADTDNTEQWIVLEPDAAREDGDRLVWEFRLDRPWKYYVQVMHTGQSTAFAATVNVAGRQTTERLNESFAVEVTLR